jgi:hypothetical protein
MAGRKITSEELAGNTDVLSDLLSPGSSKKAPVTQIAQPAVLETKEEDKELSKTVHLTMLVKEATRKEWKQFFIDHDLNTTQGIEIAVHHLIDDIENKKYKLTKGGLTKIIDEE